MENKKNTVVTHLSEEIVTEILGRLPLRSISRFKSVCKTWKWILESLYFRRLFVSMHQNKSRSWSLLSAGGEFMIDFYRCQTWGLLKSLGSYFRNIIEIHSNVTYVDSSNGFVLIDGQYGFYYVGNPILQQWLVIPNPPDLLCSWKAGLVTRVDEDGVVLSFKVVAIKAIKLSEDRSSTCLHFFVYSSETGNWTSKELHFAHDFFCIERLMSLHGMLYMSVCDDEHDHAVISHDFYDVSNVCRVIRLPDHDSNNEQGFRRTLTTCTESVMYVKTLANNVLKVWRLLKSDDWELLWETRLFGPHYAPLTMHPFERNIVYLWNLETRFLVSCNLKTQNYHNFIDDDDDLRNWFVDHSIFGEHMDRLNERYLNGYSGTCYTRFQYVLPRWMGSIPCPTRAKILDKTSLLSHINFQRTNSSMF